MTTEASSQMTHIKSQSQVAELVSVSIPAPASPALLLEVVRQADGMPSLYWAHDDYPVSFAGIGITAEVRAQGLERFSEVATQTRDMLKHIRIASDAPIPRLFGGFAFQDDHIAAGVWHGFPGAYFILPRRLITIQPDGAFVTISAWLEDLSERDSLIAEAQDWLTSLINAAHENVGQPLQKRTVPAVELPEWRTQVNAALAQIHSGQLEKVVLSRSIEMAFEAPLDRASVLANLGVRYPHTFRFLFAPTSRGAFFGATPELLLEVSGRSVKTAALAGSIGRGADPEQDADLAAALFSSPKERYEHQLVVDVIRHQLEPLTTVLHFPQEPHITKLPNIQHLHTPFDGQLKSDQDIVTVIGKLHPTPALGGYPRVGALQTIAELERVPRGWYAAPIGWLDADGNGMFAVAIRSAVVHDTTVRAYAGCGIVADSIPEREWDETRLKFRPIFDAIGAQQP